MTTESSLLPRPRRSAVAALLVVGVVGAASVPAVAAVLRVGTWKGRAGDYTSIQDAVDAAQPGDWVLIAGRLPRAGGRARGWARDRAGRGSDGPHAEHSPARARPQ